MPVIARETDKTTCPLHTRGKIIKGEASVLICFKPVARQGDPVECLDGSADVIAEGDTSVLIGDKPVAYKGHRTEHGGVIETGCPRVWIGMRLQGICKANAAQRRATYIKYVPPGHPSLLREIV